MAFDRDQFHREAVRTPSHEDVGAMRDLLVGTLRAEGIDPDVDERGNVIATREGDAASEEPGDGSTHLVLNTHLDTVPPHVPYEADGDVIRGRGACDAKGPLAAFLDAFLAADVEGRLTLAVTPDEESTQRGGVHLGETLSADGYVVGEPTGLDVCPAARGQFEVVVTIRGKSAHASDPADGTNAIRALAPVLQAATSYDERHGPGEHDLLGRPTLTPSLVEGGEATNQVPGECTLTFDRRTVPPESIPAFLRAFEAHLAGWLPDGYGLSVSTLYPDHPGPEAFATDPDARLVSVLREHSGGDVRPFGAATEASYFAADAPTVVFGPGVLADEEGPVAHADREYVRRSDVERAAAALRGAVESLCVTR